MKFSVTLKTRFISSTKATKCMKISVTLKTIIEATSRRPQTAGHKPQATNSRPRTAGHDPQATIRRPRSAGHDPQATIRTNLAQQIELVLHWLKYC